MRYGYFSPGDISLMKFGKQPPQVESDNSHTKKKTWNYGEPRIPFYTTHVSMSRSQIIKQCSKCRDTSFEMLEDGEPTNRCCRCGEHYKK